MRKNLRFKFSLIVIVLLLVTNLFMMACEVKVDEESQKQSVEAQADETSAASENSKTEEGGGNQPPTSSELDENGNDTDSNIDIYTFETTPVKVVRQTPVSFILPNGETHWYEAVYLPEGGINWVQAKALAEEAGGYLATIHSEEENKFIFNLIDDEKYWYKWDETHNYVCNGPFLGGFQPVGASEPDGGWKWVSGEEWTYSNWCQDGVEGDRDPRPNTQPNNAAGMQQNVIAFGEINDRVSYWGDFPHRFSSYNDNHDGGTYGFIIEYTEKQEN